MNYFDIAIAIPLLWGTYKGFTRGIIIELASIIGLLIGIYAGIHFSHYASKLIQQSFEISSTLLPFASFALTFIIVVVGIMLLAKVLEKIINLVALKLINKLAGALFGFIKMGLIVSTAVVFIDGFDQQFNMIEKKTKDESILYNNIKTIAPTIIPKIKELNLNKAIQQGKELVSDASD